LGLLLCNDFKIERLPLFAAEELDRRCPGLAEIRQVDTMFLYGLSIPVFEREPIDTVYAYSKFVQRFDKVNRNIAREQDEPTLQNTFV